MKIDSRAALIRAIALPGVTIRVVEHWQPNLHGTTRTPKSIRNGGRRGIQTNGYWFDAIDRHGKLCEMWSDTPKAGDLRFNADGTVTYYPGTEKSWTLSFAVPELATA